MPATPRKACGGRPWVSSFCIIAGRAAVKASRQPNMSSTRSPALKFGSLEAVTSPTAPPCSALPISNGGT